MINIHGLKNCDSCRKACKWLDINKIEYEFFDFKKYPPTSLIILDWIETHTLEKIINKRSTTWRNLDQKLKNQLDTRAINIIINSPSLMKRPIWELNSKSHQSLSPGFDLGHQDFIKELA